MSRKTFFLLGIVTLLGFSSLGGIIIEQFLDIRFFTIFTGKYHLGIQVLVGLIYGMITALLGWQIVKSSLLSSTRNFFANIIKDLNLNTLEILFISFCAGAGEEIFFRGAIQPYLGVWITAIVFVALHGYINPKNRRLSIYGAFMCLVIAGIGYMCDEVGIVSAIAAHFMIDVVLLIALNNYASPETD